MCYSLLTVRWRLGYGRRAGVGYRDSGEKQGMSRIYATWFEVFGLTAEGATLVERRGHDCASIMILPTKMAPLPRSLAVTAAQCLAVAKETSSLNFSPESSRRERGSRTDGEEVIHFAGHGVTIQLEKPRSVSRMFQTWTRRISCFEKRRIWEARVG